MEYLIIINSHVFIIDEKRPANLDKPMQPAGAAMYRRGRSTT
jgi:hypothetical protein